MVLQERHPFDELRTGLARSIAAGSRSYIKAVDYHVKGKLVLRLGSLPEYKHASLTITGNVDRTVGTDD